MGKAGSWSILIASLGIVGCPSAIDLGAYRFACRTDTECARGTICDPRIGVCVDPKAARPDAGPATPDGGDSSGEGECFAVALPSTVEAGRTEERAWWCYGKRPSEIQEFARAHTADVVSLDLEGSGDSVRATAALEAMTSTIPTVTFLSLTFQQVQDRFIAGYRYYVEAVVPRDDADGEPLLSGVLRRWFMPETIGFFWYLNQDEGGVEAVLRDMTGFELIDFGRYGDQGSKFVSLFVRKPRGRKSGLFLDQGVLGVDRRLTVNHARLLRLHPSGRDTFSGLWSERFEGEAESIWAHDLTAQALTSFAQSNGARIDDVRVARVDGERRFTAVLTKTPSTAAGRIGPLIVARSEGTFGLYLRIGSAAPLVDRSSGTLFDARDALYPLLLVHALLEVQGGRASLTEAVPIYRANSPGCPITDTAMESLGDALERMMLRADALRARAVIVKFGAAAIQRTGAALGMNATLVDPMEGCAQSASRTTLADLGALNEQMFGARVLSSSIAAELSRRFPGSGYDADGLGVALAHMIEIEGERSGWDAGAISRFKLHTRADYKASHLSPSGGPYRLAVSGYALIPRCARAELRSDAHQFGLFVDYGQGSVRVTNAFNQVKAELLREPIQRAMRAGRDCLR